MKKLLGILVLGLILVGNAYSETKFSEIKKALKEDNYGLAPHLSKANSFRLLINLET